MLRKYVSNTKASLLLPSPLRLDVMYTGVTSDSYLLCANTHHTYIQRKKREKGSDKDRDKDRDSDEKYK